MSNLNSVFDTLRGWPYGSALEESFTPKSGDTYAEGTVVKTNTDGSGGTHVESLSSGLLASAAKDNAWLVIQGNDQWDAAFVNKVTCLKMQSGCTFKIQHDDADTLVPGTLLEAASGVLQARTDKHPVGMVIATNGVSGSLGEIVVASM